MNRRLRHATIVLLAVLFVAVSIASVFSENQQERQPKFHVLKTSVELGEYYEGEDIDYTFVVRNMGLEELQILNVRPG